MENKHTGEDNFLHRLSGIEIKIIKNNFWKQLLEEVKLHKEDEDTDCFTDSQFYSLNYLAELKAKGLIK